MNPRHRQKTPGWTNRRPLWLIAAVALAAAFIACTKDLPDLAPTYAPLQTATPTVADATSSPVPIEGPSIEAVFSYVASAPGGRPLRPLFDHLPKDREPIARLVSALEAAVPIAPDDRLHANERGRYLSIRYDDGAKAKVSQVHRCVPETEDDVGKPVTILCQGEWVREDDTWWVEGVGMVRSTGLSRWLEEMPELMARIGILSLPEFVEADEPFSMTLYDWHGVIDGDSINLGLVSLDGTEIGLGTFPSSDTYQGQLTVPRQTPEGRYWLRVSGGNFSELVDVVYVGDDEYAGRQEVSVREAWLESPDTLVLSADTCNENPEVSVLLETDEEVQVTMSADASPFRQSYPDCLEAITVQLQSPLGDRVVVDQHIGREVSVNPFGSTGRQDQAESPPTEAVPPDIREAVSDAELQDLQAVAEQYGMTLREAFDRYAWNDDFSREVRKIREAAPETFAGAEIVDANNAWIAFTGAPPKAALDIIDAFNSEHGGVSVEVRTGQQITEAELEEAIPAVHYAVYKSPGVLNASTSFESETGEIVLVVVLENTAPDSVLDDLRAIAEQRLVEVTRPDILDSVSVSVVRSKTPILGSDD